MKRTRLKITGESGMGLVSVGKVISKSLKELGFYVNVDREYPSLIKGGYSSVQIDFSLEPVHSLSRFSDILIALDRPGLVEYVDSATDGSILIHPCERHKLIPGFLEKVDNKRLTHLFCPARDIAHSLGGTEVMVNMVLIGLLWKILGLPLKPLQDYVKIQFASKPKLLEVDLQCLKAGFEAGGFEKLPALKLKPAKKVPKTLLIDGNHALALGAIHAGVRAYYAYPMSPSSSILTHMGNYAHKTGMLVKQAEDEITAAQMTAGSMFMGTRALVATSGGGFDLMTETVSMAAMQESPLVVVIAQRPGPATGLPTWTSQGDFNLALHGAHGEFPRVVLSCSDPESAFRQVQNAFNLAEEFQTPVILLTEKVIAETETMVAPFPLKKIPIKRGLVESKAKLAALTAMDRYRFTDSGVSPRWLPGTAPVGYCANSDEHEPDGTLTESAAPVKAMFEKRMRKRLAIENALPEPQILGASQAAISFVGWGSSLNVMRDSIVALKDKGVKVNYLHFENLYPLKIKTLKAFFKANKNVHLIESNYEGQFGTLLEQNEGVKFRGKLLKYDGRAFTVEDVLDYVTAQK